MDIEQCFLKPVIPVISDTHGDLTPLMDASLIFLQGGEISDLPNFLETLSSGPLARIPVMINLDLLSGVTNDDAGIRAIAQLPHVSGIVTVHNRLSATAKKLGLLSIVRLFLHDGRAVARGLSMLEKSKADAIEMLPGVAAIEVVHEFQRLKKPCIAGGLIRSEETIRQIINSGCQSVSTSRQELWRLNQSN